MADLAQTEVGDPIPAENDSLTERAAGSAPAAKQTVESPADAGSLGSRIIGVLGQYSDFVHADIVAEPTESQRAKQKATVVLTSKDDTDRLQRQLPEILKSLAPIIPVDGLHSARVERTREGTVIVIQIGSALRRVVEKERLRYGGKSFEQWNDVLITDLEPASRVKAIQALGAFGTHGYGEEAVRAVSLAFQGKGDQSSVVDAAGKALAKIKEPAVATLTNALSHQRYYVRRSAAKALSEIGSRAKSAVPALVAATRDEDSDVRSWACAAFGKIGYQQSALNALIGVVKNDKNHNVREAAVEAIGTFGPMASPAIPALIGAIKTGQVHVRLAAVTALGNIGPAANAAIPVLSVLKDDTSQQHNFIHLGLTQPDTVGRRASEALKKINRQPIQDGK